MTVSLREMRGQIGTFRGNCLLFPCHAVVWLNENGASKLLRCQGIPIRGLAVKYLRDELRTVLNKI